MAESQRSIDKHHATDKLRVDYPHVGLYDTLDGGMWIARKRWGGTALRVSHAQLLTGGSSTTSVAEKDRFLCYWYHTPNTGEGPLHGYPIEWNEAHLMVRMDPTWDYRNQTLLRSSDERRIERNIDRQYEWGRKIFRTYVDQKPKFPLSWHLLGPRPADSMFYVERFEP